MTDFITPVGRIVWGNPLNGRPVLDNNKQPKLNASGQQMTQWAFGLAINKSETGPLVQAMQQAVMSMYPNGVPNNFSWKLTDGDSIDNNGQPYSNREGYAGCHVVAISTSAFQPTVVKNVNGSYVNFGQIKTGDFVRVALDLKPHQAQTPGLYVNPSMIEFIGFGDEIRTGPDPMSVFGGQAVPLPPGASATPTAPAGNMPVPPSMPGTPPSGAPAPTAPANSPSPTGGPSAAAPVPPTASPTNAPPAHDFVQNAGQPGNMPGNMPGGPTPPSWNNQGND